MKTLWRLVVCLPLLCVTAACQPAPHRSTTMQDSTATVEGVFLLSNATKEGFYFQDHVVELDDSVAQRIDGKRVRLTGKVVIIPGVGSGVNERGEAVQGRQGDTRKLIQPQVEVLQ